MKKLNVKQYLRERSLDFKEVILKYPVEMILAAFYMVLGFVCYEKGDLEDVCMTGPHIFTLAYILNNIFRREPSRLLYYASVLAVIPFFFIPLEEWIMSTEYWVELACLLLAVPVVKGRRDNRGFAAENWWFFSGIVVSIFMVTVAWLLFIALIYSTRELFDIPWRYGSRIETYFGIFSYSVAFALLALSYIDRHEGKLPEKTGVVSVLLDYIVTPAILAFNTLFYAYIIKIILQWSLPDGYVATMVFVFAIVAFAVKALRELLPKKRYGWYFDNLSYITTPALILFWIGVIYRINEYGFTESRVYLLLCGIIMTAALALFTCKGTGNYRICWIIAIALLGIFTFIHPINAARIGVFSQERRLDKLATELGLWEIPGVKLKEEVSLADNTDASLGKLQQLRDVLSYLKYEGDKTYGVPYIYEYGSVDSGYLPPMRAYGFSRSGAFDVENISHILFPDYRYSESDYVYMEDDETLRIFSKNGLPWILGPIRTEVPIENSPAGYSLGWQESFETIATYLLEKADIKEEELQSTEFSLTPEQEEKITVYEDDKVVIIFKYVSIARPGSGHGSQFTPEMIFVKK